MVVTQRVGTLSWRVVPLAHVPQRGTIVFPRSVWERDKINNQNAGAFVKSSGCAGA